MAGMFASRARTGPYGMSPFPDDGRRLGATPFQPTAMPDMPIGSLMAPPNVPGVPVQKPGFFDSGGLGSKIANGLGAFSKNYLALDGNQGAITELESERALQHAAMLRQQTLQDSRNTWLMQQQFERANPKPHYFESNNGDQYTIGPDGKPVRLFQDPTPKVQMMAVDNGDGTKQIIPFVNGLPLGQTQAAQPGGLPTKPVGKLTPLGGAGPMAPRTFR
jgi:hypothetical protein